MNLEALGVEQVVSAHDLGLLDGAFTFLSQGMFSALPLPLSTQGHPDATCVLAPLAGVQVGEYTWCCLSLWLSSHSYDERELPWAEGEVKGHTAEPMSVSHEH